MRSTTDAPARAHKPYVRQLVEAFARFALGLGIAVPLILFWSAWHQARLYSERTAEELVAILAEDARYALLVGSRPDAQALVESLLKFPDLIAVRLLDADGRVVAERAAGHPSVRRTAQVEWPVLAATPGAPNGSTVTAEPQRLLGHVRLTLSLDRAFGFALDTARASLLQLGLLTLVLGTAVVRLSLRLLAPLGTLVRTLAAPLERALPTPPPTSPAEVQRLYAAVAAMRARLAENHRRLQSYADALEAKVAERTRSLRAARDAAEQANRAKTLFLANVSHELRTPLQAIILHARLLARAQPSASSAPLEVIRRASSQLLELIEQLLSLAKVEAGQPIEITYQSLALRPLLEEVVATLAPTLAARNALRLALPDTDLALISDRARLTQVLYNLLRNADKFTDGGAITLSVTSTASGERVLIQVSDPGIGIAPGELAHIFEPLYQGASSRAGSVSSGIGLGLWLSRRIVESLGGHLSVTSTPGLGSCFSLALPVRPAAAIAHPSAAEGSAPSLSGHAPLPGQRLLLAEDEASIREPLALFLREAGFGVDTCADGTAALALLEQAPHAYAAVILDHRMPGCQGLDLLERLRASAMSTTPAVILTGDDRAPLQAAIARLGAHLMVKPVQPERLIETIVTLIEPSAAMTRGLL